MNASLESLKQLAAKATPGPWEAEDAGILRPADARFIAACDPATLTALVELVELQHAALQEWTRMPDAGLTMGDPRYAWWYETAGYRLSALAAYDSFGQEGNKP